MEYEQVPFQTSILKEFKMKRYCRTVNFLVIQLFLLFVLTPMTVDAGYNFANSFTGMKYNIYLYNTEEASTTMSFEENMSLVIDVYDGFGLYLPIGNMFIALYWSPNYSDKNDLFLIFNGMVISDFIAGWGLALPNYQFTGIFFFFGYEE